MLRVAFSFSGAVLFSLLFLFGLKSSIDVQQHNISHDDNLRFIDFVRLKKSDPLKKKERIKPKKKKPKKPPKKPKISIPKPKTSKVSPKPLRPLNLNLSLQLTAGTALGDALVSGFGDRAISSNVIPLVRINPVYPKRAKSMKKEGYVKMEFTITELGTVTDVTVVDAQPPTLFDTAAKRALLKWKFKAKLKEDKAVEQRAVVQIDFKLDR